MIILASRSPRRAELLEQIGIPFEAHHADIDERVLPDESARDYVQRLASEKAKAILVENGAPRIWPVLGADTSVVIGDEILGKPSDYPHFCSMMAKLSGHTHQVMTSIALIMPDGEQMSALSVNDVTFRHLQAYEIEAYWNSNEPHDKAGGYAIQGLAAIFIENLTGSYSGVMGLPLFETAQLLRGAGISILDKDGGSK